jgi:hypothetical protein
LPRTVIGPCLFLSCRTRRTNLTTNFNAPHVTTWYGTAYLCVPRYMVSYLYTYPGSSASASSVDGEKSLRLATTLEYGTIYVRSEHAPYPFYLLVVASTREQGGGFGTVEMPGRKPARGWTKRDIEQRDRRVLRRRIRCILLLAAPKAGPRRQQRTRWKNLYRSTGPAVVGTYCRDVGILCHVPEASRKPTSPTIPCPSNWFTVT